MRLYLAVPFDRILKTNKLADTLQPDYTFYKTIILFVMTFIESTPGTSNYYFQLPQSDSEKIMILSINKSYFIRSKVVDVLCVLVSRCLKWLLVFLNLSERDSLCVSSYICYITVLEESDDLMKNNMKR